MADRTVTMPDDVIAEVITAVRQRICWIETGTIHMRRADAIEHNRKRHQEIWDKQSTDVILAACVAPKYEIRDLTIDQERAIVELEDALKMLGNTGQKAAG